MKEEKRTNWVLTIVLILGTITVFFPLYMALIIAFKQPSEMTNDVAGALAFPSTWSFDNFRQAMEVTDFWHSDHDRDYRARYCDPFHRGLRDRKRYGRTERF